MKTCKGATMTKKEPRKMKIGAIGDGDELNNILKISVNHLLKDSNILMHRMPPSPIDLSGLVCFICSHGTRLVVKQFAGDQLAGDPYTIYDSIQENIQALQKKCYDCSREYRRKHFNRHPLDPAYDPDMDK